MHPSAHPGPVRPPVTVGEVMRSGIVTCARTASVCQLAEAMHDHHADCVLILDIGQGVDQPPVLWGLVAREDLLRPLAELDPRTTAEEIARTPIVRVHPDLSVARARTLCEAMGVSHLLVVDRAHGTPLGIVGDAELAPSHRERTDSPSTTR